VDELDVVAICPGSNPRRLAIREYEQVEIAFCLDQVAEQVVSDGLGPGRSLYSAIATVEGHALLHELPPLGGPAAA
jgi:hypothetical protein